MEFARIRANLAVMDILRQQNLPPQGSVEIGLLRQWWPRYALRHRDLDHSLVRLEQRGLVACSHLAGRHCVRLTSDGERLARSLVILLGVILALPRQMLKWLDRKTAPKAELPLGRRLTDRMERTWD